MQKQNGIRFGVESPIYRRNLVSLLLCNKNSTFHTPANLLKVSFLKKYKIKSKVSFLTIKKCETKNNKINI